MSESKAESACPDATKFETFIPLVPLVFELELFKPIIGVSVFGSETRITWPIAPKISTDSYVPQLRSKCQVSSFSRFKVIAFFIFVYEFVKYAGKNILPTQSVVEASIKDSVKPPPCVVDRWSSGSLTGRPKDPFAASWTRQLGE